MKTIINTRTFANFKSEKGHGQVIYRGKHIGWEMNYDINTGASGMNHFDTKTEAKKALKAILD